MEYSIQYPKEWPSYICCKIFNILIHFPSRIVMWKWDGKLEVFLVTKVKLISSCSIPEYTLVYLPDHGNQNKHIPNWNMWPISFSFLEGFQGISWGWVQMGYFLFSYLVYIVLTWNNAAQIILGFPNHFCIIFPKIIFTRKWVVWYIHVIFWYIFVKQPIFW